MTAMIGKVLALLGCKRQNMPILIEGGAQTTRLINPIRNFEALQKIDASQRDSLVLGRAVRGCSSFWRAEWQ
jgi:hypothetical protein